MELNFNEIGAIAFIAALVWWKARQLLRELRRAAAIGPSAQPLASEQRSIAVPLYEGLPVSEHHLSEDAERCFERIRKAEDGLNEERFRRNGCMVYEAVVAAFANGDRELLRKYLAADVYETFVRSIEDRERQHRHVEFSLVRLKHADIVDARINGGEAAVSMDFESEIVSATLNETGDVVDGDATHIVTAHDRWTFTRGWNSSSQAWLLSTTETSGERRVSKFEKSRTMEFEEHTGQFRPCT